MIGGAKERKDSDNMGSMHMSISINDKGGDCWQMLSLMSKGKQRVKQSPEMSQAKSRYER